MISIPFATEVRDQRRHQREVSSDESPLRTPGLQRQRVGGAAAGITAVDHGGLK